MTSDTMAITAIARTLVVTRSNILEKKRTLHLTPLRNNQNSFFNGSHSSFFSTTFTAQFLQLGNFLMALRKVKVSFDLGDILRLYSHTKQSQSHGSLTSMQLLAWNLVCLRQRCATEIWLGQYTCVCMS